MKTLHLFIISVASSFCLAASPFIDLPAQQPDRGFLNPPDSIQTGVYWYWISDNVSKEGVVKDLYAMKAAGINRAFIGNIGLGEPYGKVTMLSEEWWAILHEAMRTATKLGIEIGVFNSPGSSQSGGPWIKPSEAMRYLASSEFRVAGPVRLTRQPDKPNEIFQDVKLIAYPVPIQDTLMLDQYNARVTSSPVVAGLSNITDGKYATGIRFPANSVFTISFESARSFTARSLSIRPSEDPMRVRKPAPDLESGQSI